jgi:hypothetical protein
VDGVAVPPSHCDNCSPASARHACVSPQVITIDAEEIPSESSVDYIEEVPASAAAGNVHCPLAHNRLTTATRTPLYHPLFIRHTQREHALLGHTCSYSSLVIARSTPLHLPS